MRKYTKVLFSIVVSTTILASCSTPPESKEKIPESEPIITSCEPNFIDQPLEGSFFGEPYTIANSTVRSKTGDSTTYAFSLFLAETDSTLGESRSIIFFTDKKVGVFEMEDGMNYSKCLIFKDKGSIMDAPKKAGSCGAIEILEITEDSIMGRVDVRNQLNDSDCSINGYFRTKIVPDYEY